MTVGLCGILVSKLSLNLERPREGNLAQPQWLSTDVGSLPGQSLGRGLEVTDCSLPGPPGTCLS